MKIGSRVAVKGVRPRIRNRIVIQVQKEGSKFDLLTFIF